MSVELKEAYLQCTLGIRPDFPELNPLAATLLIANSWLHVLRHQSVIDGYPFPKKGPAIVTGNHQCIADNYKVCIAGVKSGRLIRAVAKKGLVVKGFSESEGFLKTIADETAFTQYNPINAFVLRGEGVVPVDRENPDRKFLRDTDEVLRLGGILGIYLQPHRYKDCFLRNLQVGAATIARKHPDIPIYPFVLSGPPYGKDKITILKPFTYNQKVKELDEKISVGEFTIMIADLIAQNQPLRVQEDWQTRREQELKRLTSSKK